MEFGIPTAEEEGMHPRYKYGERARGILASISDGPPTQSARGGSMDIWNSPAEEICGRSVHALAGDDDSADRIRPLRGSRMFEDEALPVGIPLPAAHPPLVSPLK